MSYPKYRLRIQLNAGAVFGPGKADLLEHIANTGSIAAAGRAMGMSYKRAWLLVDTLNSSFIDPLVRSERGGATGGGAVLTDNGLFILAQYRLIEQKLAATASCELNAIVARLTDMSEHT